MRIKQLSQLSPLSIGIVLVFAAAMTYFLFGAFAASGTATLYTSPGGTQSVTNGQTFTVVVRISSGASVPVTGASVYLSYPSNILQVAGESYDGSPYNTQLLVSDSGGVLRMDRAAFPAVAGGDQVFAQVSFKAVATGSATIGFTGSSVVTSGEDDSNILTARNGVTYNVAAPSSGGGGSSSSGGSSQPTSSSTSSGGSSSSSTSGGSKPSASSSSSASSGGNSSTSNSTGGAAGSAQPSDGSDSSVTPTTEGSQTTNNVKIAVVDGDKPVSGAKVALGGQTANTDKSGFAYFNNVPVGRQAVKITYKGKQISKQLVINDAAAGSPQLVKVAINNEGPKLALLLIPVAVLLAVGAFLFRPWERWQAAEFAPAVDEATIVSSDHPASSVSPYKKLETPGATYAPGSAPGSGQQPANPPATTQTATQQPNHGLTPGSTISPETSDQNKDDQSN